jgi:hypothetical protein
LSECLKKKDQKKKLSKKWLTEKKYSVANVFKRISDQDLHNYLRINKKLFPNLITLIRPKNDEKY